MLFLRKIAIFALRITGRRVGDGPGEMPEWSIGPHSKCGVRVTVPGVRIPLSPQTTGWSAGLQTFVCNLFYFRGGQIYPERSEDKSWSYGWQAKIRSSQGRLRSDGGKDGRHAVTRSPARSAEEWKRGEMLYGSTAFLCLQRGKVVRMDCGDREWLIRFLFRDICNLRPDRGKWRAKFLPHSSPSSNGTQKGFKGVYISFKNYLLNLQMIRHE